MRLSAAVVVVEVVEAPDPSSPLQATRAMAPTPSAASAARARREGGRVVTGAESNGAPGPAEAHPAPLGPGRTGADARGRDVVRHTGRVRGTGFRLRVSPLGRLLRSAVLLLGLLIFVPGVIAAGIDLWWRLLFLVGSLACVAGLRILWGSVVVVRPAGLRVQRNWPFRRDFRWYRILAIDVVPGFWHLEVELNSGERITLPAVDDLERLYQLMEQHRQALDA